MPLEIVTVPCLHDNYAYLLRDGRTGTRRPGRRARGRGRSRRRWRSGAGGSTLILITHHHDDHIDGVEALRDALRRRRWSARRRIGAGCRGSTMRSRRATRCAGRSAGRRCSTCPGTRSDMSPITSPEAGALFSADSLMVMGCGRLFEGTPGADVGEPDAAAPRCRTRRWSIPDTNTRRRNIRFALSVEPDNPALRQRAAEIAAARADDRPTVPARARSRSARPTRSCARRTPTCKARLGNGGRAGCRGLRRDPASQGRLLKRLRFACAAARAKAFRLIRRVTERDTRTALGIFFALWPRQRHNRPLKAVANDTEV